MNSYAKTTWVNNQTPALSAQNLKHIEDGIYAVTEEAKSLRSDLDSLVVSSLDLTNYATKNYVKSYVDAQLNGLADALASI